MKFENKKIKIMIVLLKKRAEDYGFVEIEKKKKLL